MSNPGLPIRRTKKRRGDHEMINPALREWREGRMAAPPRHSAQPEPQSSFRLGHAASVAFAGGLNAK